MLEYDKSKMEKSIEKTMKHPYWKQQYEKAPSKECKDYLEYTFYSSDYYDPDAPDAADYAEKKAEIEGRLGVADWEYLKQMTPNSPFVGYCNQKIKELSAKR